LVKIFHRKSNFLIKSQSVATLLVRRCEDLKIKVMPQTVFNADGEELEVLTPDEVKELQEKAQKVAELEKEIELAKQEANPNWSAARKKMSAMEAALKEKGLEINEDGTLRTEPKIDVNEITAKAESTAKSVLLNSRKSELLSRYDETKRPVIEKYFDKLSSGEELNFENIGTFIKDAEKLAGVEPVSGSQSINGKPPVFNQENIQTDFSETDEGKEIANRLFGENSFAKEEKK